nr:MULTISPECIES: SGNH/GDSL hydrolase family protein [unclassified Xanthobacter]
MKSRIYCLFNVIADAAALRTASVVWRAWCASSGFAGAALICVLGLALPAAACPVDVRPSPALVLAAPAVQSLREGGPLRILAIGSSSTTGVGASRPEATYPAQLAHRLVEMLGEGSVEVTNAGVSGESAPSTLKRLEAFLTHGERPDLVIWQVGTNDVIFGGNPERLTALVRRGLEATAAADVATIVVDQQYFPLILDVGRYEQFVSAVDDTATERNVPLLRRYAMMKQWAAEDPAGFKGLFAWDHFHMNDKGYACLAQQLADAIAQAVSAAKAPPPPAGALRRPDAALAR